MLASGAGNAAKSTIICNSRRGPRCSKRYHMVWPGDTVDLDNTGSLGVAAITAPLQPSNRIYVSYPFSAYPDLFFAVGAPSIA
jgi:hypothetical protein